MNRKGGRNSTKFDRVHILKACGCGKHAAALLSILAFTLHAKRVSEALALAGKACLACTK